MTHTHTHVVRLCLECFFLVFICLLVLQTELYMSHLASRFHRNGLRARRLLEALLHTVEARNIASAEKEIMAPVTTGSTAT